MLVALWLEAFPIGAQRGAGINDAPLSTKEPAMELRLVGSKVRNGLPEQFTFDFVNISDRELRMPRPSQCSGGAGTVLLRSRFVPADRSRVPSGGGGGCGSGTETLNERDLLKWANSWCRLKPGESLAVTYSRQALFNFQEDEGSYDFWGEYVPPQLTAEQVRTLASEGFHLPPPLVSKTLHFRTMP